jgi:hypothetical protein
MADNNINFGPSLFAVDTALKAKNLVDKETKLYSLKPGSDIKEVEEAGENDNLNQVYLVGNNGKNYVLESKNDINNLQAGSASENLPREYNIRA